MHNHRYLTSPFIDSCHDLCYSVVARLLTHIYLLLREVDTLVIQTRTRVCYFDFTIVPRTYKCLRYWDLGDGYRSGKYVEV
jgi:hypothetical protein